MKRNLEVFKSLQEDSNVGWVWIPPLDTIRSRDHIKLSVESFSRSVLCIARTIDDNFLRNYNGRESTKPINLQNQAIVISDYYREKLGIQAGENYEFDIHRIRGWNFVGKTRALLQHPDNTAKIAGWLALISIGLSLAGVILSLCSII